MERRTEEERDYYPRFFQGDYVNASLLLGNERVWVSASIYDSRPAIPRGIAYVLLISSDRKVPEGLRNRKVELVISSREEETRIKRIREKSFS